MKFFKLLCFLILFESVAFGADQVVGPPDPEKMQQPWSFEKAFIRSNLYVSQFFDGVAEKIDLFLAGRDNSTRRNETSVRIESLVDKPEGPGINSTFRFGVNLRLPNLEDYWQLKFSTYDPNEESRIRRGYQRTGQVEQSYGATVGLFKKLGNIRTAFQPRIELQDPLKVSHSLKFDSVAKMDGFEINPKLEFFASPDKGTGVFAGVNFNFFLSKSYSLAVINEGEYQQKTNFFTSNSGLSLLQNIKENSSLSYNIFFNSTNRPVYHLEGYSLSVAYSEVIYKKILDYQIIPHWDFGSPTSFHGTVGITAVLGLNF